MGKDSYDYNLHGGDDGGEGGGEEGGVEGEGEGETEMAQQGRST